MPRTFNHWAVVALASVAWAGFVRAQFATSVHFSVTADDTLQGNTVLDGEAWTFNTLLGPGFEVSGPLDQADEGLFTGNQNLDAFSVRNGIYYLSVQKATATMTDNGLAIDDDDIVRYDPSAPAGSRASIFFDPDTAGAGEGVDAISFHTDGSVLISFTKGTTFDGLTLEDGDVLKFDPTDFTTKSIFFDESATFLAGANTNGFSFVSPTEVYLTTAAAAGLPGLPSFTSGDVVRWNGTSGFVHIAEAEFGSSSGSIILDALSVPEPQFPLLLALAGCAPLFVPRRRRTASRRDRPEARGPSPSRA